MSQQIANGMRAGHIASIGNFDVNIAIYSKTYQYMTGRAFEAGKAIGTFKMVVSGGSKISANRFGSTIAQTSSCDSSCQEYCGSVCSGGSCHTDCTHDCVPPTDPSTPGPTPGPPGVPPGGYGGVGGASNPGNADGTGTSSGPGAIPDDPSSIADHSTTCAHAYKTGSIHVRVDMTSTTHTVENLSVYYTGTGLPTTSLTQRGTGSAVYNPQTGQYHIEVAFTINAADGVLNSTEVTAVIDLTSQQDYFSESGWWDYYTMTLVGL